ncbi:hypothetical protein NED98_13110 [Sphingomonas sp. MMSM20]|uniref:hypothetical protein n=1 Tax=Sphingomonas lycopersici TaxID=2951807 RepID=UPI0022391490|nr:hypothetical protein [Sphingomonas lycopersici]MCW6531185.1 hypothetical protein [Sphingomonas lycopersici]
MKTYFHVAAAALAVATPAAAETLTNQSIVLMTQAKLGDEAIVAKIRSSDGQYNLDTNDIIALKNNGVSGPVIAAMLSGKASGPAPAMSLDSPDPMVPHPSGVYLVSGQKMARIDATASNQAKTGGILGYALTGGLASMSVKASIQNPAARVRTENASPTFYFFFDESNPGTVAQSSAWQAGTAATVTAPSEFTLIKLMEKKGRREARVGSVNIGGAKTGVMDSDRLSFDYQMVRPGVFKVSTKAALAPGEYGFIYSLTGGAGAGAMTARIFDFGVDKS